MSQNNHPQPSNSPPAHRIQLGSIQAAIWANEDSSGTVRYNATFTRRYLDRSGNRPVWKETNSFAAADCVVLSVLARQAADWIQPQDAKRSALQASP